MAKHLGVDAKNFWDMLYDFGWDFAGKNSSDEIRAYNHVKESQRKLEVEEQAKKKQEQPLICLTRLG